MNDSDGGALFATIGFVIVLGFVLFTTYRIGHADGMQHSEINVLNGAAQYRLEKQDDSTIDWIKVTPYAVNCEPARE